VTVSEDCVFCKIVEKKIPSRVVYEDEELLAFHDIAPLAPVHFLVIPKRHIASVAELPVGDPIMGRLTDCANRLAKELGVDQSGYRLMVNCGPDAGQTVYHLHMNVLGGGPL